jgi:tellurite resistance protein TerB
LVYRTTTNETADEPTEMRMALWDQLKSRTQTMNAQLKTKSGQFRNKEFANGSMAMCALIAAADGSIEPSERQKTAALIGSNDVLTIFDANELRQKFDWYCDKLNHDFDFGKVEAIATIGKLKAKPDQARAVVSIGIIIGGADGNFDEHERKAVRDACFAVGIPPAEFDL